MKSVMDLGAKARREGWEPSLRFKLAIAALAVWAEVGS